MTAGYLMLEDGRRFDGVLHGAVPTGAPAGDADPGLGEVVFQTGMSGYQEVITDPSYRGQIVTFTAPHIGNTGINRYDAEAERPALAGVVLRALPSRPSSWRSEEPLDRYLARHGIPVLAGIDTRALTRHLRTSGALRGAIVPVGVSEADALARVVAFPGLVGRDLVREVAPGDAAATWSGTPERDAAGAAAAELADAFPWISPEAAGAPRITLVHCGMKEGIDACLRRRGARVRIVPPTVTAAELLGDDPDGILLSNGPGDPDALGGLIATVREVVGRVPLFGICLGFQVLALALGGRTVKMRHGHHGINHPVQDLRTGRVLVTSQNHGFAVERDSLATTSVTGAPVEVVPTHASLNDGTFEGFAVPELRVTAVQFHPEARGGPHDAASLFDEFLAAVAAAPAPGESLAR